MGRAFLTTAYDLTAFSVLFKRKHHTLVLKLLGIPDRCMANYRGFTDSQLPISCIISILPNHRPKLILHFFQINKYLY